MTISEKPPAENQEKIDKWSKKAKFINQYYAEREVPVRSQRKGAIKRECKWCEKFRELDFYHCLHCGSVLKK